MREPFGWRLRWYRIALGLASSGFRTRFLDEAVATLGVALRDERERGGRVGAWRLWARALVDAGAASVRDRRDGGGWFAGAGRDLQLGVRVLRRSPQFAAVTIGTLAFAIGGFAAVFTLADPMLFKSLPYGAAGRLVSVSVRNGPHPGGYLNVPDVRRLEASRVFDDTTSFDGPVVGRLADRPEDVDALLGYRVAPHFFETFGIGVALGRTFTPAEHADARSRAESLTAWNGQPAIITDALWRSTGAQPDVVGRPLRLANAGRVAVFTIVGVLKPDFVLPDTVNRAPAFLVPGNIDVADEADPRNVVSLFARLPAGMSVDAARASAQAVIDGVTRDFPQFKTGREVRLTDLRTLLFQRVRLPLLILLAVTACVLALALGNLSHLSMARAGERTREIVVRRALGAGRWRIVRLMLVESCVLAAIGGLAALLVSRGLFLSVTAAVPRLAHVYRLLPAGLGARVILLVAALSFLALILVGLVPAWMASRTALGASVQSGTTRIHGGSRVGSAFLTGLQAMLASSVLVATLLLLGSFVSLVRSVKGIDESNITTAAIEWPTDVATGPGERLALSRRLVEAVRRRTGRSIGLENGIPGFTLPGGLWKSSTDPKAPVLATLYPWDREAVDAFRLQIVDGRLMTPEEVSANDSVVVIDQTTARLLAPGISPIGMLVEDGQVRGQRTQRRVVGVVRALDLSFGRPVDSGYAFAPIDPRGVSAPTLVWRGRPDARLVEVVRDELRLLEPRAVVRASAFEPFERRFGEPRLLARLTGALGLIAIALTIAGVYAVTAHGVGRRRSEIGLRMALGASAPRVQRMIVRESLVPASIGAGAGLAAAGLWARTIDGLLFGLSPHSPAVFAASAAAVLCVVAVAALLPASRASRIDPTDALRAD